jgi:hypothetical protein
MASLSGKPQLLPTLQGILRTVNIIRHSRKHEHRLAIKRMEAAKPEEKLIRGGNYWNLAVIVIDNIDFKAKTFTYGNIYEVTRKTSHATLRMIFQFKLPIPLEDREASSRNGFPIVWYVTFRGRARKKIPRYLPAASRWI